MCECVCACACVPPGWQGRASEFVNRNHSSYLLHSSILCAHARGMDDHHRTRPCFTPLHPTLCGLPIASQIIFILPLCMQSPCNRLCVACGELCVGCCSTNESKPLLLSSSISLLISSQSSLLVSPSIHLLRFHFIIFVLPRVCVRACVCVMH